MNWFTPCEFHWTIRFYDLQHQLVNKRSEILPLATSNITIASSVAREGRGGGLEPPHWPEKYAKSHVFSAFEADFCSKNENSPPKEIGEPKLWRSCRHSTGRTVWICDFGRKIRLNFGEDLFFCFFFGDHLILGGKSVSISDFGREIRLNFSEDLFFGDHLFLEIIWFKINENLGQGCLQLSQPSKKAPTPSRNPGYAPGHCPFMQPVSMCFCWFQLYVSKPWIFIKLGLELSYFSKIKNTVNSC